jgi:hypothetical protein
MHPLRSAAALAALASVAGCGTPGDAAPPAADAPSNRETAAAPAAGWSPPRVEPALSDALGRDGRHNLAAVAVDAAGTLHAVFGMDGDGDGRAEALRYARMDDGAWSPPQPVAATPDLADPARVAVDGDGTVHVLWLARGNAAAPSVVATDVVWRALRGGLWSAPRVLYREPHRAGLAVRWLAAATDARGDVQVLFPPQGRGFGHLTLRGASAGTPRYLDHEGNTMAFSAAAAGAPLEVAYVGERVSRERPRAESDVFVRTLAAGGEWSEAREAHAIAGRFAHYPQPVVDARGTRHLFWLEDTDGSVKPEAVFHATSADGVSWSRPEDVTPPGVRGGVPLRVHAAADGADRIHLLIRYATAGPPRVQLAHVSLHDGRLSAEHTLARAGEIGPGEASLAVDARRGRVLALWRGGDGVYRWSALPVR